MHENYSNASSGPQNILGFITSKYIIKSSKVCPGEFIKEFTLNQWIKNT